VPDGQYLINLLFMNTFAGTQDPGDRIFSVAINGEVPPQLEDFDQVAAAGGTCDPDLAPCIPVVRSAMALATAGTGLEIEFLSSVRRPSVKGIEVLRCDPAGATPGVRRPAVVRRTNATGAPGGDGEGCARLCGSDRDR